MKKVIAAVLALSILLCGSALAQSTVTADMGKVLVPDVVNAVRVGEPFGITLSENASTGYSWSYTIEGDGIELTGEITKPPKGDLVGAPSQKTWVFRAVKAGDYVLRFTSARSWEKDTPPAQTEVYRVKAVGDDPKVYTVKKNKPFTVTLTENPSTGYAWMVEPNDAFKLIRTKTLQPKSGLVGAPNKKIWTFKVTQKGVHVLRFVYARSFESAQPIKTAEYVFFVK